MRILAIETALLGGSVAVLLGSTPLAETMLPAGRRTAQSLAPAMQSILRDVGWGPRDIELVAVSHGPGSFTGLRIGVTAAKTLAYATGSHVLGVDTLAVLAHQVPRAELPLWVVMDAEREQLFSASFQWSSGGWVQASPPEIVNIPEFFTALPPASIVSGPALSRVNSPLPGGVQVAPDSVWTPRAVSVGQVADRMFAAGQRDDVFRLRPHYIRESAAEEKARQGSGIRAR